MGENENNSGWVYVYIVNPGKDETLFGLHNVEQDIHFVPAFRTKEEANDCFLNLPREKGKKYELQAIHIEELHEAAAKNNCAVAMIDQDGKVIKDA
jgi:hypothetical protein